MRYVAHLTTMAIATAVLAGVPVLAFGDASAFANLSAGADVVSSATTVRDSPSGRYTVYVNRAMHEDADALSNWTAFFAGEDVPLIMEDIDCLALAGDTAGIEMAESLRSRLPANQMKLRVEDATMALSKADAGLFDALVMSEEAALELGASSVAEKQDVVVIRR